MTPPIRRPNADGTISVGPLEIMTPERRREALAAAPLHGRRSTDLPEVPGERDTPPHGRRPHEAHGRTLAGHHESYSRLTAARGPTTHTAGRAPTVRTGMPAPGLELRGTMVREYGPLGSTRHWEPRLVETAGGSRGLPPVHSRTRLTVEQRIQNALSEARRHLAGARMDARLGADERANSELTAAEAQLTRARRLARGARSLSAETRADLHAVAGEVNSTLGTIIAAGI